MLALHQLGAYLTAVDAEVFGETVKACARRLEVIAVSGVKDHFTQERTPEGVPWAKLRHPRPGGGDKVLRDKGLLAASVSASVTEEGLTLRASHPGANVHQFGATIRPKSAKFLAIPASKEGKRAGRPRDFPRPLHVVGASGATALLGEEKGKRVKTVVVHYYLVKEVAIPARKYLGFSPETVGRIMYTLASEFESRLLKKAEERTAAYYADNPIIG